MARLPRLRRSGPRARFDSAFQGIVKSDVVMVDGSRAKPTCPIQPPVLKSVRVVGLEMLGFQLRKWYSAKGRNEVHPNHVLA